MLDLCEFKHPLREVHRETVRCIALLTRNQLTLKSSSDTELDLGGPLNKSLCFDGIICISPFLLHNPAKGWATLPTQSPEALN
jgi:hypothetical protein